MEELFRPVFSGPSGVATTFGWFAGRLNSGIPFVSKAGGQSGVATQLCMIPSEDLACLVLTNQSKGRALAHSVCNQILATYLPGSALPNEDPNLPPAPFQDVSSIKGRWSGTLANGGANMPAKLEIQSVDSASFALADRPAEKISNLRSDRPAFTGTSSGLIVSADAIRHEATILKIKLIPSERKLVGRIVAEAATKPGAVSPVMLPYVLTLHRIDAS
jgi:hypothetical protein